MTAHVRFGVVALAAAALFAAATLLVLSSHGAGVGSPAAQREAHEEARELTEPADALMARQVFGSGARSVPATAFARAAAQSRAVQRFTARRAPSVAAAKWELTGPTNIGGRVLDIAVDPVRPDTIFIATATGGVWRSDDAGRTFEPAWPADQTQAIGAIAMTPSGVLYAGTGEAGPGGGSLSYGGTGVYRSDDRGRTWKHIGLRHSSRIGRIQIDPQDDDRVYVAATGNLFKPSQERGLYRTDDGGRSWQRVLKGANATTGVVDVQIDPQDPDRILAATWDLLREPDKRRYTGPGSGLYRSTDGGTTWERLPVPAQHPTGGRIGIGVAPGKPDRVYVMASGESGAYNGFFVSDDFGTTFQPRPHPLVMASPVVYGWWFGRVVVDPADPNHVFVAGLNYLESRDGGLTFEPDLGPHADQHALAYDLKKPKRVYLGNDGGVYRSEDNGANWAFAKYQPFSQLYGLDVSAQDPEAKGDPIFMTAGLQDNGAVRSPEGEPDGFTQFQGGDGQRTLINPENPDIVYSCIQYGDCRKSVNRGSSGREMGAKVVSSRKNWFTPIELDPENPAVMYTGGEILSRSTDAGETWTPISGDLSDGPGRETNPLFRNFGTLTTIAPKARTIYAGTDDGNLWYTHDGGGTWTKATDGDLPTAWVTRVELDPRDPRTAYAAFSGFRIGEDAAWLYRTTDGGKHWAPVNGNLPDGPLNDVNVLGDLLVAAGDVGVFASRDAGRTWLKVGSNLPLAPVHELRYHEKTESLYAATFGRSMWRIELPASLERVVEAGS